jgi:hypothetical protein
MTLACLGLFPGCASEISDDVGSLRNALNGATVSTDEGGTVVVADGSRVESEFVGIWLRPVPLDGCDVPFCKTWEDIQNAQLWMEQYAFESAALRIHNRTSQLALINFEARLRCVYASGPTFPAPVHTTGSETQRGEVAVSAGDTLDVPLECGHEAFVSDGAWVTYATIDLSVVEDWDPWD